MRNTDKTKKEFEKSLFKLLSKKNYHDITVNEICSLANKTTFICVPPYSNDFQWMRLLRLLDHHILVLLALLDRQEHQ